MSISFKLGETVLQKWKITKKKNHLSCWHYPTQKIYGKRRIKDERVMAWYKAKKENYQGSISGVSLVIHLLAKILETTVITQGMIDRGLQKKDKSSRRRVDIMHISSLRWVTKIWKTKT